VRFEESGVNLAADSFMLDLFRTELETHARVLDAGLATAEGEESSQKLEPLMRAAHSLKGAARMVGLDLAVRLAHAMEDVLSAAQHGKVRLSSRHVDALLRGNDVFLHLATVGATEIPAELGKDAAKIEQLAIEIPAIATAEPPGGAGLSPRGASAPPASNGPDLRDSSPARAEARPPTADAPADSFMLDLFRTEMETHARVLDAGLATAEGEESAQKLEPLMRAAHSLKGAARMVGLDLAVRLAHSMEDVLSAAQHGKLRLSSRHVDALLRGNDVFLHLATVGATEIPAELDKDAAKIEQLAMEIPAIGAATEPPAELRDSSPARAEARPPAAEPEEGVVRVFAENLNRLMGLAGECLVQAKSLKPLGKSLLRIRQDQAALASEIERIQEGCGAGPDGAVRIQTALQRAEQLHAALLGHAGEFESFARRLEVLSDRLYTEAVATRMRPFREGLHGYPRMVRDLAKSIGKSVRLEIEGSSTHVDRDILQKLEAPLTHLLRNAVDHGIETPEERAAAGKPAEGRVTLEARHVSGVLDIKVVDDGAGIDLERLRRKVVEKGYAPADMAENLSEAELLDFLFLPGFSTKSKVTEVSGRGVGLDIVQAMAREVGGVARIETRQGAGTTFHLQLPLTLSVLRALLVEVSGGLYAVPLVRIDRVLEVAAEAIQVMEDRQFCVVDGANVGIVDACQPLQLPPTAAGSEKLHIIVISDVLNRYGIVVNRFHGERDLVVIPFHPRLRKVANLSAGAILEDGAPVLILDVDDLVRSVDNLLTRGRLHKVGKREQKARAARKHVLVVDDSLTVREVERRLLENRGYDVVVAVDGMDGWNALQSGAFDLVVTDVDMPRLDGIELVRRIRAFPRLAGLPVMIVSYKDQEEYRRKGLDAGANYYLTKSSFHDETLLDVVRDLIGEAQA
jgi:two-component system sensor histidine kinase and response regulator WspE